MGRKKSEVDGRMELSEEERYALRNVARQLGEDVDNWKRWKLFTQHFEEELRKRIGKVFSMEEGETGELCGMIWVEAHVKCELDKEEAKRR